MLMNHGHAISDLERPHLAFRISRCFSERPGNCFVEVRIRGAPEFGAKNLARPCAPNWGNGCKALFHRQMTRQPTLSAT